MNKLVDNTLKNVMQSVPAGAVAQISDGKRVDILENLENLTHDIEVGLARMGLTNNEARVYIFLAKKGTKKASEIAKLLDLPRTETYNILNSLQKKGLVSCALHYPVEFIAVPFENALNTLVGMEKEKLITLERQNKMLLDNWLSIANHAVTGGEISEEKFQILEGNNSVYNRIRDVISSAEEEVLVAAGQKQLMKLYHNEITDHFHTLATGGADVKVLTTNEPTFEVLKEIKKCNLRILTGSDAKMNFIVVDKTQMIFFIKDGSGTDSPSAIWTDCEPLVKGILCLFEELWKR